MDSQGSVISPSALPCDSTRAWRESDTAGPGSWFLPRGEILHFERCFVTFQHKERSINRQLRIGGCTMPCAHPRVLPIMRHSLLVQPSWKKARVCGLSWTVPCVQLHLHWHGGSFPALFLLLAVLGAAMAGAVLASLFYRLDSFGGRMVIQLIHPPLSHQSIRLSKVFWRLI